MGTCAKFQLVVIFFQSSIILRECFFRNVECIETAASNAMNSGLQAFLEQKFFDIVFAPDCNFALFRETEFN